MENFTHVDAYIQNQNPEHQNSLNELRKAILATSPLLQECIKYGMPTYVFNKNVLHFASCKNHLGIYPGPKAILHFAETLKNYTCSKGSIHFSWKQEIDIPLIISILNYNIQENVKKKV